jgi:hypothetical protein
MDVPDYIAKYSSLEPGQTLNDETVSLAGRCSLGTVACLLAGGGILCVLYALGVSMPWVCNGTDAEQWSRERGQQRASIWSPRHHVTTFANCGLSN